MTADRRQIVERLCSDALDLDPPSRATFLSTACPDDGIRREVLSLLALEPRIDGFLEVPVDAGPALAPPVLRPGQHVGPYEVIDLLGSGGMGHVYRARDTRLHRDVALKVLSLAGDARGRARFLQEARVLATLNHPNVAAIYGIEELEGEHALALELVDGTALDARLEHGPLALDEAVAIARQMAGALEAAQAQHLTHRDLKPSNVMVRKDGTVKLLDFGIARALTAPDAPPPGTDTHTQTGLVLGTTAYMSPEQARGEAIDGRTDIWAFGCVLFEMLSGRAVFARASAQDTLAAVLTSEPDWAALPAGTPPALVRLLRRCLQRDRSSRMRDIADVGFALDDLPRTAEDPPVVASRVASRRWIFAAGSVAALGVVLGAGALIALAWRSPAPVQSHMRFELTLPTASTFGDRGFALSPDGMSLAFVAADKDGDDVVWIRRLDQLEPAPVAGTKGAYSPFWAPDGHAIAFFAQGKLKRISANGGDALVICDVVAPANQPAGVWGPDDTILFAQSFGPIHKVAARGGAVTPVTVLEADRGEFGHYNPAFLPDGQHFAFEIGAVPRRLGLHVGSLTSTVTSRLMAESVWPFVITDDGTLLFRDGRALRAQLVNLERLELTSDAVLVADGMATAGLSASKQSIVYRNESAVLTQLTLVDRTGRTLDTVSPPGMYSSPILSPDDSKVAVARDGDIWVVDLARRTQSRVTSDPVEELFPQWSPDGREILFNRGAVGAFVKRPSTGAGAEEVVLDTGGMLWDWSADGHVTYGVSTPGTFFDLYTLSLKGDRAPTLYLQTPFQDVSGKLSPDGTLMAYSSLLSGRQEIYVQPFPSSQERWQVSIAGGAWPRWRSDGRELFYVTPDGMLMAVAVSKNAGSPVGTPRPLFRTRGAGPGRDVYSPSSDGRRFLLNAVVEGSKTSVTVVLDWKQAIARPDRR
jgi:serine/threonine protein kinase/Tol biopolymer transport system component